MNTEDKKMIIEKTVSILHFEDDKLNQILVKKILEKRFGAYVRTEGSLNNVDWYIEHPHLLERYNAIICDYMFPNIDATIKLKEFARCDKPIIFYTCLDEDDWKFRVIRKLGHIPKNFSHLRKANRDGQTTLCELIGHCLD